MKQIIISENELLLSRILGGSESIIDIGLDDTEHMLPLYSKKGGNHKRDIYLENPRFFRRPFSRGRHWWVSIFILVYFLSEIFHLHHRKNKK